MPALFPRSCAMIGWSRVAVSAGILAVLFVGACKKPQAASSDAATEKEILREKSHQTANGDEGSTGGLESRKHAFRLPAEPSEIPPCVSARISESGGEGMREVLDTYAGADATTRAGILEGLVGSLRGEQAVGLLENALSSGDKPMVEMVGRVLSTGATNVVLQKLVDVYDSSNSAEARADVARIVQSVSNPEAIFGLADIADGISADNAADDSLAWSAVSALNQIGSVPSARSLLSLMDRQTKPEVVSILSDALVLRRSFESLPAFAAAASGDKTATRIETRLAAVRVLSGLGTSEAKYQLGKLLSDPAPEIREAAKAALKAGDAGRR